MADPGRHKKERIKSLKPTKSQLNAIEKLKRWDWNLHVTWSKRGIIFPLVKVEIQAAAEPHVVRVGSKLLFSITVRNLGEVVWKKAKLVISIHNKTGLLEKKLIKRINK